MMHRDIDNYMLDCIFNIMENDLQGSNVWCVDTIDALIESMADNEDIKREIENNAFDREYGYNTEVMMERLPPIEELLGELFRYIYYRDDEALGLIHYANTKTKGYIVTSRDEIPISTEVLDLSVFLYLHEQYGCSQHYYYLESSEELDLILLSNPESTYIFEVDVFRGVE